MADRYALISDSSGSKRIVTYPDTYISEGTNVIVSQPLFDNHKSLVKVKVVKTIYSTEAKELIEELFDTSKLERIEGICLEEDKKEEENETSES